MLSHEVSTINAVKFLVGSDPEQVEPMFCFMVELCMLEVLPMK